MKPLLLGIVLAQAACVKQGQVHDQRPTPALRDICNDARFKTICTPQQMPGATPVQVDTNLVVPHSAPLFS
jgi:hypothetical protein